MNRVQNAGWIALFTILCVLLRPQLVLEAQESCPLPPRLTVGERGQVLLGFDNYVRAEPSRAAALIRRMQGNSTFNVLAGPQCADGMNWWQVTYDEQTGWAAEGASDEYWLTPYPFECETNLVLGEPAVSVMESGIYAAADSTSAQIGVVPADALIEVGTEVVCAGYYGDPWVQITYNGLTGWAATIWGDSGYGPIYGFKSRPTPLVPVNDAAARLVAPTPVTPTLAPDAIQRDNISQLAFVQSLGEGTISDFAWSPSGDQLAVTTTRNLRLYNAESSGAPPQELDGHDANIQLVRFSPDGTRLASADASGRLILWDAVTGTLLDETELGTRIGDVVFSPDSRQLAASIRFQSGGTLAVFHAGTNLEQQFRATVLPGRSLSSDLVFTPDGTRLLMVDSGSARITMWDTVTGRETEISDYGSSGGYSFSAWTLSPDGRYLTFVLNEAIGDTVMARFTRLIKLDLEGGTPPPAVGIELDTRESAEWSQTQLSHSSDGRALWGLRYNVLSLVGARFELFPPIPALNIEVTGFASAPHANVVAVAGNAGEIRLYTYGLDPRPYELQESHVLYGIVGSVTTMEFDSTGTRLAARGTDNTIRIWDTTNGQRLKTIQVVGAGQPFAVRDELVFSGDRLWDGDQGTVVEQFNLPSEDHELAVGFSPDGVPLAVTSNWSAGGEYGLWNVRTGTRLGPINERWIDENGLSRDGRLLNLGLTVFDIDSRQPIARLAAQFDGPYTASLSPDNRLLLIFAGSNYAFDDSPALLIREVATGDLLLNLPMGDVAELDSVAWSNSGRWVSWANYHYEQDVFTTQITTLDLQTQEQVVFIIPESGIQPKLQFTPDEALIAVGRSDGQVQFYDWASGALEYEFEAHAAAITQLLFSEDGSTLYTAADDHTIRIWRPRS